MKWNPNYQNQKPKLIGRVSDTSKVAKWCYLHQNYQQNYAKKFDVIEKILGNGIF